MIVLNKNSINTVVFTLKEKHSAESVSNTYYLFRFYDDFTGFEKLFIAENTSTNISRYDRFDIELNETEDVSIGKIFLENGMYDYTIYESLLTNQPTDTYNVNTATKIVEVGRVNVVGIEESRATYTQTNTKAIYNG